MILGRSFLAIVNIVIHCQNEIVKISFGNMTVELNLFDISHQPLDNDNICEV